MENYKLQYLESVYENLTELTTEDPEEHQIYLAKNSDTGKIVVKKYIDAAVLPVYQAITQIHDSRLESILHCGEDGKRGLVILEYISGTTLSDYMQDHGLFKLEEACGIICNLLEVLAKVHKLGIVHRDIKPENIMISSDGMIKLVDFGISRRKKELQTSDTTILGTAGYAAPEQFGFGQTDERADIYAVGVLFNQLLTGKLPKEQLYPGKQIKNIIVRCTQMDAKERYQSAEELLRNLWGYIYNSGLWRKAPDFYKGLEYGRQVKIPYIWIPGFRTGKVWKMVTAILGYGIMLINSLACVLGFFMNGWRDGLLGITAILLYIWINTFLALNVGNWDQKVPVIRKWPRAARIIFRIILWFVLFYVGIFLQSFI